MDRDVSLVLLIAALAAAAGIGGIVLFGVPDQPMCTVSLDSDGGVSSVSGSGEYAEGSSVTVTALTMEWYVFDGWFSESGELLCADASYTFTLTADVSLTARSHTDRTVTVVLEPDAGVLSCSGGGEYVLGSEVVLEAQVKDGYRFLGWYGPGGLVSPDVRTVVHASDTVLQVRTAENGRVNVTLEPDVGIRSVSGGGSYAEGTASVLSAELEPGYSFRGWYFQNGYMLSSKQTVQVQVNSDTVLHVLTVPEYTVDVLGMPGLSVTGGGTYAHDIDAVLSVYETVPGTFRGWFSPDGTCLSTDAEYTPARGDALLIARSDADDLSGDGGLVIDAYPEWYTDSSYCIVTEHYSRMLAGSFQGRGDRTIALCEGRFDVYFYNGLYDGSAVSTARSAMLGTRSVQTYHWVHGGTPMSLTLEMDPADYHATKDQWFINRAPTFFPQSMPDTVDMFADPDCAPVTALAAQMKSMTSGMTPYDAAGFVLDFVQQAFVYETDSEYTGDRQSEYWKFSAETLFEHRGDCEDTSLLYAAVMTAMGYDAAVILFDGHMAAGLNLEGVSGKGYEGPDGLRYVYCETTGPGWGIGQMPPGYDIAKGVMPITASSTS